MKLFQANKLKIILLLCTVMLLFKVFSVQEYLHIHQHQEEKLTHNKKCDLCNTIFQVGKGQVFEYLDTKIFQLERNICSLHKKEENYSFTPYRGKIKTSKFYNKPPPYLL